MELASAERAAIARILDGKCEARKLAKLTVTVDVELAEKKPQEAP